MSKIMQNLVVLMEPSEETDKTPLKVGNMILNRFCIDEDAAFELSGVTYLKKTSWEMRHRINRIWNKKERKGKDYSFLRSWTFLIQFAKYEQLIIVPKKHILMRTLLYLHYKKLMKTSPKNLKSTLFVLVGIIIVLYEQLFNKTN